MSETYLVSPSQFRAHKDCTQLHYYIYGLGLRPAIPDEKFARGIYFHELAHFYYQLLKSGYKIGDQHTLSAMDTKLNNDLSEISMAFAGTALNVHLMFRNYLARRTQEIDSGIKILEVEKMIEYVFPGTDVGIHGIVDLIYRHRGQLVIRDHKTGENKSAHSNESLLYEDQLMTYACIIWKLYNEVPAIEISWINAKVNWKEPPTNEQLYNKPYRVLDKQTLEAWWTYIQDYLYHMQTVPVIRSLNSWKCKSCAFKDPCLLELKGVETRNLLESKYIVRPRNHDYVKFTELARKNPGKDGADKVSGDNPSFGGININFS